MNQDIKYKRMAVECLLQMFRDTNDSQYLGQAKEAMATLNQAQSATYGKTWSK